MPLAFGAKVWDGPRHKVFTVTYLDNDAPADLTVTFLTSGMSNFAGVTGAGVCPAIKVCKTASAADTAGELTVKSYDHDKVVVRKTTPAGAMGADAKTFLVSVAIPRGVNS